MTEWFDGLSGIEQFLFTTGVGSTLIFTIQFFMTLIGITDDDADTDGGDGADDGYSFGDIFTIRNGVNRNGSTAFPVSNNFCSQPASARRSSSLFNFS